MLFFHSPRLELCHFSQQKIYPSRGRKYVRVDGKVRWNARTAVFKLWVYCRSSYTLLTHCWDKLINSVVLYKRGSHFYVPCRSIFNQDQNYIKRSVTKYLDPRNVRTPRSKYFEIFGLPLKYLDRVRSISCSRVKGKVFSSLG